MSHVFLEPPIKPNENKIFIDDVNKLVKISYPMHQDQHPLFKKFGIRTGGFCDKWIYTEDWKNLSDCEKWKYVALCSLYWQEQYRYWYEQEEYKNYKNQLKEWAIKNPEFLTTLKSLEEMEN